MRNARRRDEGAAAVEFALVVPILLLLVFGIIQFGLAFAQVLALNSAARQGARVGVTGGPTCAEVVTATRNASKTIGIDDSVAAALTVTVRKDPTTSATTSGTPCSNAQKPCAGERGSPFRVTVEKPFGLAIPFPFIDPAVTLTGKGEYRCESDS